MISPAPAIKVRVRYRVLGRWTQHHFDAQIQITAKRKLGHWNLALRIPGSRIQFVLGARWRAGATSDLGVAYGMPWPWARSPEDSARIVVFGTGAPRAPVGCAFDGHPCTFERVG